jgi:hypothetical protein
MPRSKLTLNNGRECEVGSCPCDERGDKLRALVDSAAAEGLSMGAIQKAYTELALEALALFSPALPRETALAGLDMEICYRIRIILWNPPDA